jgi:AraC-like DNA-binding protein
MSPKFLASSYLLNVLCRYAAEQGIDCSDLHDALGCSPKLLEDPTVGIPMEKLAVFWNELVIRSGDSDFGLHFGENVGRLTTGHALVSMLINCPTIEQALEKMTVYQVVATNFFHLSVRVEGEYAYRTIEMATDEPWFYRHHLEATMSTLAHTLRMLTMGKIQFLEASFVHDCPADTHEHQRIFSCPILFNQPRSELKFRREVLSWRIPMANEQLLTDLEKVIDAMAGDLRVPNGRVYQVIQHIQRKLKRAEIPTLESVAVDLATSPRQLQNQLKQEATTYQVLLDQCRREAALRYLKFEGMKLSDIACLLGFSGQSSFNHAFKRWTGKSPKQYIESE